MYLIPGEVGGTEIYLRHLLAALARVDLSNQYVVYTNRETGEDLIPAAPHFRWAPQRVRGRNRAARLLWEQFVLPFRLHVDVLLNAGFTAPVWAGCPQVTVFQDVQHKRHPEFFRWFDLPAWQFFLWAAAHASTRIIAASPTTRDDLLRFYSLPRERIKVVPHGVDERFFAIARERQVLQSEPGEPILLYVSTLHRHKNHLRLLNAFARFLESYPQWRLVLAGIRGFHAVQIERRIEELNIAHAVKITGWIPREELYEWYRRSRAFIFPSEFEGFGLPVSEALAAGLPTACSDIEPLRSVAAGAAWLFPPQDEEAMLAAIEKLARGERPPGEPRLDSWEDAARKTLAVLTAAVAK